MATTTNKRRRNDEEEHQMMRSEDISDEQMAQLEAIEKDLLRVNIILDRDHERRCQPIYQSRRNIFSSVPTFWSTAWKNHNELSAFAQLKEDVDALGYLKDVVLVRDAGEFRAFTVEFHFDANPYFSDTVLKKEYRLFKQPNSGVDGQEETPDADGLTRSMIEFDWERDIKEQTIKINWKNDATNLTKKYPRKGPHGEDGVGKKSEDFGTEDADGDVVMGLEEIFGSWFHFFEAVDDTGADLAHLIADDFYPDVFDYYRGTGRNSVFNDAEDSEDEDSEDDDDDAEEIDLEKPRKKKLRR